MITNTLMKRMNELKKDRDRLAMQVMSCHVFLFPLYFSLPKFISIMKGWARRRVSHKHITKEASRGATKSIYLCFCSSLITNIIARKRESGAWESSWGWRGIHWKQTPTSTRWCIEGENVSLQLNFAASLIDVSPIPSLIPLPATLNNLSAPSVKK